MLVEASGLDVFQNIEKPTGRRISAASKAVTRTTKQGC
jgi:hypothetical protein